METVEITETQYAMVGMNTKLTFFPVGTDSYFLALYPLMAVLNIRNKHTSPIFTFWKEKGDKTSSKLYITQQEWSINTKQE